MHLHRQTRREKGRPGLSGVAIVAGLIGLSGVAMAGEGPLLWNASKSGDTLNVRPGLALAMPGNLRLGLESSLVAASPAGAGTTAAPLALWSELDLPGSQAASTLGMRLDARSGAGRAILRQSRSLSAGPVADLQLANAFEAGQRADGSSAFIARQELRLEFSDIGAALAGSAVLDNAAAVATSLKLEQKLPLGISLTATLTDLRAASNAVIRAGLSGRW
jgi:hypothetical protein